MTKQTKKNFQFCLFDKKKALGTIGVKTNQQSTDGKVVASEAIHLMNNMSELIECLQIGAKSVSGKEAKKVCLSTASSGSMLMTDEFEPSGTEHQMKEIIDISNSSDLISIWKDDTEASR